MRMRHASSNSAVGRSLASFLLVFVLVLVPVGCGSGDDDDLAVAGDLIEQWMAGWNGNDADGIAAAFAEDGTFINEGVHELTRTGREEIRQGAEGSVSRIGEMELTGPVTMADDGTFRCTIAFRAADYSMVAENEFTVDDGLISRLVGHDDFVEDGN